MPVLETIFFWRALGLGAGGRGEVKDLSRKIDKVYSTARSIYWFLIAGGVVTRERVCVWGVEALRPLRR